MMTGQNKIYSHSNIKTMAQKLHRTVLLIMLTFQSLSPAADFAWTVIQEEQVIIQKIEKCSK